LPYHLHISDFVQTQNKAKILTRINSAKFKIVPIGEVEDVDDLAHILGCHVASLPLKYLGLPLAASYKATSIWSGVIEKIERRLTGEKKLYLSKGGRLTLIKSTLSNLPMYYMSLLSIFVSVTARFDRLQRDVLWGGIGDAVKMVGRCALELEALWRSVIEVKYVSMRGGWFSTEVVGTYGVSVWKHIRRGWDSFSKLVRFPVGVQSNV
jgi:hypothetical protein